MGKKWYRPKPSDIFIGEDLWIDFIDVSDRLGEAVEIDGLMASLMPFWDALNTICVAECCGFDAFDFSQEGIASAVSDMNLRELHMNLEQLVRAIENIEATVILSKRMNNYADKQTFLKLLAHIRSCIPREQPHAS